jgi:hypothetical protein
MPGSSHQLSRSRPITLATHMRCMRGIATANPVKEQQGSTSRTHLGRQRNGVTPDSLNPTTHQLITLVDHKVEFTPYLSRTHGSMPGSSHKHARQCCHTSAQLSCAVLGQTLTPLLTASCIHRCCCAPASQQALALLLSIRQPVHICMTAWSMTLSA